MNQMGPFAKPSHWMVQPMLGIVVSVNDPQGKGRVQVRLPALDPEGDAAVWARVAVQFAGDKYGAFFIPNVDTEVLVVFIGGDPAWPIVVGNLWNGKTDLPESIGSSVDRWTLTGKAGTRIAIVEENPGQEKVEIETPNGQKATLTDEAGGQIKLQQGGNSITLKPSGITVTASAKVTVNAPQVQVTAGMVKVDTAFAEFTGMLKCQTLLTTTVISSVYTPGAGNVW